jgi:hypothetical protein
MFKFSRKLMVAFSGVLWMLVGLSLLSLGLHLLSDAAEMPWSAIEESYPVLRSIGPVLGGHAAASVLLICGGLAIGYLKCRFVLAKTVRRVVTRIVKQPEPMAFGSAYSKGYIFLILGMMGLGMSIKYLGGPSDIRGLVDTAVGSALINGALLYFRNATALPAVQSEQTV